MLVPILWPAELPERHDYVRALLYDPPPPPPPPLPRGSGLSPRPVTRAVTARQPASTAPVESPMRVPPLEPETQLPEAEQSGSADGSDLGIPEGMEGGVEGGVVGGVPGGVLGGVLGGTGDVLAPVKDYDKPPRLIRQVKPTYPREAFAKKIEGVVIVELLIDANGRIAGARVTQSVPLLDEAALVSVRQWLFEPAVKQGRPVATLAYAPISFRIY